MTWQEDREIGRDYPDLGYMYPVILRKGLRKFLFVGFITGIEESQGDDGGTLTITALGWSSVFGDDTFNKVYSDARPGEWVSSEDEDEDDALFQPDKFDYDHNENITLTPRRGVDFLANEYVYVRYLFPFQEQATRISLDFDLALPQNWPGRLEIRDDNGALWSRYVTESGSLTLDASSNATYFEVRFYVTEAGENTAEDGAVYGKLSNVVVYGHDAETITPDVIAKDMIAFLTAHGLSSSTAYVEAIAQALLRIACIFGRSSRVKILPKKITLMVIIPPVPTPCKLRNTIN